MFTRLFAALGLTIIVSLFAVPAAFAEKDPIYTGAWSNLAVEGYDPVAYFEEGKPIKGEKAYRLSYKGAEFRFSSAKNKALFNADPAKYAPQYGGYCAWAMANGDFAKGDAAHWAIVDGKLYLNYNKSIQNKWNKDRSGFIRDADKHWPDILKK